MTPNPRARKGIAYRFFNSIESRSRGARRGLNRFFYNYLGRLDRDGEVRLMNYGFASGDERGTPLELLPEDEPDRNSLQLYHAVASGSNLQGRDVLEVGSGRGGGASFVARYHEPRTVTGIDYARESVEFCLRRYAEIPSVAFIQGDAEALPFPDESFDAVINVESSHCYGNMERFLDGAYGVLRPGGHFLWADHRHADQASNVVDQIRSAEFDPVDVFDITANVLASLDQTGNRNLNLVNRSVPAPLRKIFYNFSGVKGTLIYEQLERGELIYQRVVAKKPE